MGDPIADRKNAVDHGSRTVEEAAQFERDRFHPDHGRIVRINGQLVEDPPSQDEL